MKGRGWFNHPNEHRMASYGLKPRNNNTINPKGKRKFDVKSVDETWYHQTSPSAVDNILDNGFIVEEGGNQRYGVGVYLMDNPEGQYGESTLEVNLDGRFIDLSDDRLGRKWKELKGSVDWSNYQDLTEKLKERYPDADGIELHNILVVWNLDAIKDVEVLDG